MTKNYFIIFVFLLTVQVIAQNPNLGTSGAQFLEIPVGARGAALGGAYIGLADDITAVFWNPAGVANIASNAAHFSYMRWFDMFDYNAVAVGFNVKDIGAFSVSAVVFSMDKTEITTELEPNGTGRYFDAMDLAIGITYSKFLTDKFAFGITAKYISQMIWNESAEGFAFDVGTQYRLDWQNITISMSMRNFGSDLQYLGEDLNVIYDKSTTLPKNRLTPASLETDSYPLPLVFQVGINLDLITSDVFSVRAEIDAVHPNDNRERLNIGSEISFFDRLYLRGGYRYNYDDEDLVFGAGASVPFKDTKVKFDYSYGLNNILPNVHRISVGVDF
ncbi:MAG: PorV/PorQ family protein [Bacteroidetes bacterium]|nr:PorV/PorQ family protein [Bacteroidota bacterium]MBU1113948.1 PorV/PorQ family protein [Bacteroidota bacterium]MBU1798257.1 PorV/PorQ family protein [Bacteroidota bacterium]